MVATLVACPAMLPSSKRLLLSLALQGYSGLNPNGIRAAWSCQPKVETICSWKGSLLGKCLPRDEFSGMKSLSQAELASLRLTFQLGLEEQCEDSQGCSDNPHPYPYGP